MITDYFVPAVDSLAQEIQARLTPIQADDEIYMAMAVDCAKKGVFLTRPNPSVGCVLVKDGQVVGAGTTAKVGGAHAEVMALQMAGDRAVGATAYVTLEPCSHTGRTPPCCQALIVAKVARVVVANIDPNPKVSGRGIAWLLEAGIVVSVGVLSDVAATLNLGFLKAMATGLPYVRAKLAISLDGRIAMANGESKWITGTKARWDVQNLRARSGAIITGSTTILADNPLLNVRGDDKGYVYFDGIPTSIADVPVPKIVVIDRRKRLSYDDNYQVFLGQNVLLWRDDLLDLLKDLVVSYHCYDVLVEAGATLITAFLQAGLVDELIVYQAPCLLGETAKPMFLAEFEHLGDCPRMICTSVSMVGEDIKSTFVCSAVEQLMI